MIDNPEQVERLLARLQAALPVPARLTPEAAAALQGQNAASGELGQSLRARQPVSA